jgi:hypothetical protein
MQVPAALFAPLWIHDRHGPRWAIVAAVAPIVVSCQQFWFRNSFALIGWLGIGTLAWFGAVCGLVFAARSLSRPDAS